MEQPKSNDGFNRGEPIRTTLATGKKIMRTLRSRLGASNQTEDHGGQPVPATPARDDAGAVLILALIFLVVVGGVVGSLSTWARNDLNNTAEFTSARTLQYAVSSATQTAIANIRYTPLLSTTQNASPPAPCWGSGSTSGLTGIDGYNVDVWCSTVWTASSVNTRVVTFYGCPVTAAQAGLSPSQIAANCATNPYLQAVVTYGDYPPGDSKSNTAECQVYCGQSMTVNSWIWS
jgi:hypothetical protein